MQMSRKRKRKIATILLAALLLPAMAFAQGGGGLFGLGDMPETAESAGTMGRGSGGGYNLTNQHFGADANGGYELSNQTFGQESPMGSGLAILMVAGMGYAAMKSRKKNQKSNN